MYYNAVLTIYFICGLNFLCQNNKICEYNYDRNVRVTISLILTERSHFIKLVMLIAFLSVFLHKYQTEVVANV